MITDFQVQTTVAQITLYFKVVNMDILGLSGTYLENTHMKEDIEPLEW